MLDFIQLILFILPAYFANAVPVILGGGSHLDLGRSFPDGERVFGNGKTIRGFIAGIAAGIVVSGVLAYSYQSIFYDSAKMQFFGGAALAVGTMIGDALGSFIKRRMRVQPGKPFILDQLSFLIIALVFVYPFAKPEVYAPLGVIFLFGFTYLMHAGTNFLANRIGLKKVPW